jgi:hypothetical protein
MAEQYNEGTKEASVATLGFSFFLKRRMLCKIFIYTLFLSDKLVK